ncbi:unnamed protein product [Ilex paraguariensis]|uniref:Uncharacterized protein n=1 Tax=Ilex paraguariensis TaxID=185542 RepID=A0ABC8UCD3_9AQUA
MGHYSNNFRSRWQRFSTILFPQLSIYVNASELTSSELTDNTLISSSQMEEMNENSTEVNSADANKEAHTIIICLNKKRKFQAEQLGLPLPKHKCRGQSFTSQCGCSFNENPEADDFHTCTNQMKIDGGARDDESKPVSRKDCRSSPDGADSVMFVCGEANHNLEYPKTSSCDQPSTSSVNWDGDCFKTALYSLDSRAVTKYSGDKEKSPYIVGELNSPDLELHTSLNYEEHLEDFGSHVDYSCSEYRSYDIEQYIDKELEDMLHLNGVNPNNYVLSSGRWNVNQEAQPGAKKLTIDKEFEQYFSMLML